MAAAEPSSFIFVGGLHRSGTTLVADWLAQHPEISGLRNTGVPEDEGQHLQRVFPTAGGLGGVRFGESPAAHMTEVHAKSHDQIRAHRLDAWSPYWDSTKRMVVEKSPPNLLKTRFLQAIFPTACFVIVVRHPAVVSYAVQRWTPRLSRPWVQPIHGLIRHWVTCHEILESDAPSINRLFVTRYEDIVSQPMRELDRLFEFLKLPAVVHPEPPKLGLNEKYFRRWKAPFNPARAAYTRAVGRMFESRVRRFGYTLRDPWPLATRPGPVADLPLHFDSVRPRR